jgi:hypothetical protein
VGLSAAEEAALNEVDDALDALEAQDEFLAAEAEEAAAAAATESEDSGGGGSDAARYGVALGAADVAQLVATAAQAVAAAERKEAAEAAAAAAAEERAASAAAAMQETRRMLAARDAEHEAATIALQREHAAKTRSLLEQLSVLGRQGAGDDGVVAVQSATSVEGGLQQMLEAKEAQVRPPNPHPWDSGCYGQSPYLLCYTAELRCAHSQLGALVPQHHWHRLHWKAASHTQAYCASTGPPL